MKKYYGLWLVVLTAFIISCSDSTSPSVDLNQPSDFVISQQDLTEFMLVWTDNSKNEAGYKIERKFDAEAWQEIAQRPENANSYVDDISVSRQSWNTVYYKIYAYEGSNQSLPAEGEAVIDFPAPTNLTGEYGTEVLLQWADNTNGEDGFIIERKTNNGNFEMIGTEDENITMALDSSVQPENTYTYRIAAYVGTFNSSYTNEVEISTFANVLHADFSAAPVTGFAPLTVNFTDLSSGNPISWTWNFGNGESSTLQNPIVSYLESGSYDVTLVISDGIDQDTETKFDFIVVNDNPNLTLYEDFEGTFLPSGWLKLSPDGGSGWEDLETGTSPLPGWTGGEATACPGGGSYQAYCTWTTGGATSNDQWLITPQFTVQDGDMLNFWMAYYFDSYMDHVEILLSTTVQNDVNAFDIIIDTIDFPAGSSTDWTEYAYNLTDFVAAGTPVYIAFRENVADNFNDGSAIGLDNIMVANESVLNKNLSSNYNVGTSKNDLGLVHKTKRK